MQSARKAYPSDISDEEWSFVAPYVSLLPEEAPQRRWPLREVLNGLRWIGPSIAFTRCPAKRRLP